jgi:hypothetical protein
MMDSEGFTLALFKPSSAIDARGRALKLEQHDWDGMVSAADAGMDLPETGEFQNQ